ncbi:hypothetical protein HHUSO_G11843 [Huso huso]|uniref:Uncharacterized protein n=1 Tax=Huso huso TaxID=61971 RepID=A0ABR0ZM86_HUSHU
MLTLLYITAADKRGYLDIRCPTTGGEPTETTSPSGGELTGTTAGETTTTWKPTMPTLPDTALCRASSMTVELPSELLQVLLLSPSNEWVDISNAPSYCNYSLVQGRGGRNFFTAPYRACDVRIQDGSYILTLLYITIAKGGYVHMRCPIKTTTKPTKTSRTTTRKTTSITIIGVTEAPATVVCTASSMVVELPKEPLRLVKVLDKSNRWVAVIDAPKYCNYTLLQGRGGNFFITPYTACDVRILDHQQEDYRDHQQEDYNNHWGANQDHQQDDHQQEDYQDHQQDYHDNHWGANRDHQQEDYRDHQQEDYHNYHWGAN